MLLFETTWMDFGGIVLSEINQRQILQDVTYTWNLKKKKQHKKPQKNKEQIEDYQRWVVRETGESGQKKQTFSS